MCTRPNSPFALYAGNPEYIHEVYERKSMTKFRTSLVYSILKRTQLTKVDNFPILWDLTDFGQLVTRPYVHENPIVSR